MPVDRLIVPATEVTIAALQCNGCGRASRERYEMHTNLNIVEFQGGYGSDYPGDLHRVEFVLCDTCAQALVAKLLIPPTHFAPMTRQDRDLNEDPTLPVSDPESARGKATLAIRAVYAAGYAAHRSGVSWRDNPHPALHPDHEGSLRAWWDRGWSDAALDQGDAAAAAEQEVEFRRVYAEQQAKWAAEEAAGQHGFLPQLHLEDPPGLGLCSCGSEFPHAVDNADADEEEA